MMKRDPRGKFINPALYSDNPLLSHSFLQGSLSSLNFSRVHPNPQKSMQDLYDFGPEKSFKLKKLMIALIGLLVSFCLSSKEVEISKKVSIKYDPKNWSYNISRRAFGKKLNLIYSQEHQELFGMVNSETHAKTKSELNSDQKELLNSGCQKAGIHHQGSEWSVHENGYCLIHHKMGKKAFSQVLFFENQLNGHSYQVHSLTFYYPLTKKEKFRPVLNQFFKGML